MKRGWWAVGLVGLLAACESTSVPKTDLPDSPNPGIDAGADGAPLPPGSTAPKLAPIGKQTLVVGKTTSFRVSVERGSLTGPLELTFSGLPAGVTAKSDPIAADATSVDVTLSATENAPFGTVKASVQVGKEGALSTSYDLEVRGVPGTLDKSFGSEGSVLVGSGTIQHFAVHPAGGFVAQTLLGTVTKWTASGALDSTFGSAGATELADLIGGGVHANVPSAIPTIDSAGTAYVAFDHRSPGGTTLRRAFVARLTPLGTADPAFGANGMCALPELPEGSSHRVQALALLSDGSLVVATQTTNGTTADDRLVLRHISQGGTLDTAWGTRGDGTIVSEAPTAGIVLMAPTPSGGVFVAALADLLWQGQWTKAGASDATFGLGLGYTRTPTFLPSRAARLFAKRRDGSLDVGYDDGSYARTSRYTPTGTADPAYVLRPTQIPASTDRSKGALVDSLGRTYFGFQQTDPTLVDLWRLNPDGSIDATLNATGKFRLTLPQNIAGLGSSIESIHELADGRILVFVSAYGAMAAFRFWP